VKLHNTLTRKIEPIAPLQNDELRIYSCGPTVYDHAHIGNLSAYIFADTLNRVAGQSFGNVTHVMNYTDVDDKTIRRSGETYPKEDPKIALQKLTDTYIDIFMEDLHKIGNNVAGLTFMRATERIPAMKELITRLHAGGFAYLAEDGVYFSIEAYRRAGKTYGQLLELTASNTSEARIQNDEYDKESVHDFALWKKQKDNEPAWDLVLDGQDVSGRPGWHIECSAMSRQGLGQPFDIHTGGVDLIFPHHENEIAQSTALEENSAMATVFAHNEHILVDGKKMSKSLGNFYTLEDIVKRGYDPLAFRLLVLQAHYKSQTNFTWESLTAAQNRLAHYRAVAQLQHQPIEDATSFTQAGHALHEITTLLADDLATPQALAVVSDVMNTFEASLVSQQATQQFVDFLESIDTLFGLDLATQTDIDASQKHLIKQREEARQQKDWDKSDALRKELTQQGIGIRDTPHGPIWFRV
jgi:cysteinyl-tRNA synthetase